MKNQNCFDGQCESDCNQQEEKKTLTTWRQVDCEDERMDFDFQVYTPLIKDVYKTHSKALESQRIILDDDRTTDILG